MVASYENESTTSLYQRNARTVFLYFNLAIKQIGLIKIVRDYAIKVLSRQVHWFIHCSVKIIIIGSTRIA